MRVKVALLADYSNVSREGKLNILGIFDTIYAQTFPVTHAHMQLVIRFEGGPEEAGTIAVQRGESGEPVRADHILSLTNVGFADAGRYVFEISVDGRVEATVPLRVEHIPARH